MKKSPYPNISDELWNNFVQTHDANIEAAISKIVNTLWNETNQPALSVYEIEGRKVAMRWGIRLGLSEVLLRSLEVPLRQEWMK